MANQLPFELKKFSVQHCKLLKQNLKETKLLFREIIDQSSLITTTNEGNRAAAGSQTSLQHQPLKIDSKDEILIRKVIDQPPSIVLMSTSERSAQQVANDLMQRKVFPLPANLNVTEKIIRFSFKKSTELTSTITRRNVSFQPTSSNESYETKTCTASLGLDHPLLRAGWRIIVLLPPTDQNDRQNQQKLLQDLIKNSICIVVYALDLQCDEQHHDNCQHHTHEYDQECLAPQHIDHLHWLKSVVKDYGVFFVQMSSKTRSEQLSLPGQYNDAASPQVPPKSSSQESRDTIASISNQHANTLKKHANTNLQSSTATSNEEYYSAATNFKSMQKSTSSASTSAYKTASTFFSDQSRCISPAMTTSSSANSSMLQQTNSDNNTHLPHNQNQPNKTEQSTNSSILNTPTSPYPSSKSINQPQSAKNNTNQISCDVESTPKAQNLPNVINRNHCASNNNNLLQKSSTSDQDTDSVDSAIDRHSPRRIRKKSLCHQLEDLGYDGIRGNNNLLLLQQQQPKKPNLPVLSNQSSIDEDRHINVPADLDSTSSSFSNSSSRQQSFNNHNNSNFSSKLGKKLNGKKISQQNQNNANNAASYSRSVFVQDSHKLSISVLPFVKQILRSHLIDASVCLNTMHERMLQNFTLLAFELARNVSVTPTRIQFVKGQEQNLYNQMINSLKYEDLRQIVDQVLRTSPELIRQQMLPILPANSDSNMPTSSPPTSSPVGYNHQNICSLVSSTTSSVASINNSTSSRRNNRRTYLLRNAQTKNLIYLTEEELNTKVIDFISHQLSQKISQHLVAMKDCLTGTLMRCLQQLESTCKADEEERCNLLLKGINDHIPSPAGGAGESNGDCVDRSNAQDCSRALNLMMTQACKVDINLENVCSSLTLWRAKLWSLLDMFSGNESGSSSNNNPAHHPIDPHLFTHSVPGSNKITLPKNESSANKNNTQVHANSAASNAIAYSLEHVDHERVEAQQFECVKGLIESMSADKMTRFICNQIRERLKVSHELFGLSLKVLENNLSKKLEYIERRRIQIRRAHAPRIARLALESASLTDTVRHGVPKLGRELGRGQYGVVYACDKWAGHSPCAVKSVVPPDERHWGDMALEFCYTKCVPRHDRLVALYGVVIDHSYGSFGGPSCDYYGERDAVLMIMERCPRELYYQLKRGMKVMQRLQVALDVIEGIRFLHSQGFIHRDIKLKNVMLDHDFRAKLTDFGFTKPHSLVSGSVVGTPVHMSPEVFNGNAYGSSVDIYAFGILFWFLMANQVRLPTNFEPWMSRDLLRNSINRGVRPERLASFNDEQWDLMQACWHAQPEKRPLAGIVQERLIKIKQITHQHLYNRHAPNANAPSHSIAFTTQQQQQENGHNFNRQQQQQQPPNLNLAQREIIVDTNGSPFLDVEINFNNFIRDAKHSPPKDDDHNNNNRQDGEKDSQ